MENVLTPSSLKYLIRKKKLVLTEENTEKEMQKSDSFKENSERGLQRLLWFETKKKEFEN